MTTMCKPGGPDLDGTLEEQFLDLVCSDEDLLRAEFEAIIAAEWATPPRRPPLRRPADPPPRPWRRLGWKATTGRLTTRPRHPGIGGWARQRSPPAATSSRHPGEAPPVEPAKQSVPS